MPSLDPTIEVKLIELAHAGANRYATFEAERYMKEFDTLFKALHKTVETTLQPQSQKGPPLPKVAGERQF